MNINALLGTISFVLWSSFSVWFYVNNIYEFDNKNEYITVAKSKEIEAVEKLEVKTAELAEVKKAVVKEEIKVSSIPVEVKKETVAAVKPAAINITKEFNFDKNSDQVNNAKELEAFVSELKSTLTDRTVTIQIIGYTCDLGSDQYNRTLGQKRAQSVAKALDKLKIDQKSLVIDSKGEQSPVVPNDTESNRTKNRRVTVIINSTS